MTNDEIPNDDSKRHTPDLFVNRHSPSGIDKVTPTGLEPVLPA